MANTGKTIATLLVGAAVGAAVGYIMAMDSEERKESVEKIKEQIARLKNKLKKEQMDLEEEIFNA